jgi:hypothetical protein
MKLVILLFLNALFVMHVVAEEKSPYKVIILDENVDASKLAPHQVQKKSRPKDFPSIERRNSDFLKAGIISGASEDELDKDLLWISAKHSSLSDLQEKYPKIPKEKLTLLMGLVKK